MLAIEAENTVQAARIAALEAAEHAEALYHHDHYPLFLTVRPAQFVNEGSTPQVSWRSSLGSTGQPVTITLPDIDGVTFEPKVITADTFTGGQNYRTVATFGEVDADTLRVIVPTVAFAGLTVLVRDVPAEPQQ